MFSPLPVRRCLYEHLDCSPTRKDGDSWLGPPPGPAGRGSSAVDTSRGQTRPDEHHVRGVLVPGPGHSARDAGVGALGQRQCVLGSRSACRAVHGGVGRVDETDVPAVLPPHLDEGLLGGGDRRVGGLAGHRGPGEEPRPEVLHGDRVVIADHLLGPFTAGVLTLTSHFLVRLRPQPSRFAVTTRGGLPRSGLRRAIIRSYLVSFARALRPYSACGRSCSSDVVVAVSRTPQSTPIARPFGAMGRLTAGTTNEAYQGPRASWYTRTLDGSPGRSRDHTTPSTIPPAKCRRPPLRRNPCLV